MGYPIYRKRYRATKKPKHLIASTAKKVFGLLTVVALLGYSANTTDNLVNSDQTVAAPLPVIQESTKDTSAENLTSSGQQPLVKPEKRVVAPREKQREQDLYTRASIAFGSVIPASVLRAVHQTETRSSKTTCIKSSAGATGPMQFIPKTWEAYKADGDGNGTKDICDLEDAVYGASNYLSTLYKQKSGSRDARLYAALYGYNHADWYVQKVLKLSGL